MAEMPIFVSCCLRYQGATQDPKKEDNGRWSSGFLSFGQAPPIPACFGAVSESDQESTPRGLCGDSSRKEED